MVLGEVDYGLNGVVGGLTAFIVLFNRVLASAVSRYYAFSVGRASIKGNEAAGLEECRKWFTVALTLHLSVAVLFTAIGYPLGCWAIRHYLVIPVDRVSACIWVWRFACLSCFVGMINVPFNAMYYAKQYIAELTIYSFVTTTLNVCVLYYMLSRPNDWLVAFALWTSLLSIIPGAIIDFRSCLLFKECRVSRKYLLHWPSIRHFMSYSMWNCFGTLGGLFRTTGISILVNKLLGPAKNASVAVANSAASHAAQFSGALVSAFIPAITNAMGANDRVRMIKLVHTTCKFGTLLVVPFLVPLVLEIDKVMEIWLKKPPEGAGALCVFVLFALMFEKLTNGHWAAIAANGVVAKYQFCVGLCAASALPTGWILMKCGLGLMSVGWALLLSIILVVTVRLIALKVLVGISPRYWLCRILLPMSLSMAFAFVGGYLPRLFMASSMSRIVLTTLICESVLLPLVWFWILDAEERSYIVTRVKTRSQKLLNGINT